MPIERTPEDKARFKADMTRIEKTKPLNLSVHLHMRCQAALLAEKQKEPWQIELAEDLNVILTRAQWHLECNPDRTDVAFAKSVLRIVARVSEFEGIRRAKP